MAKRNNVPIDIIWVHVNTLHVDYAKALTAATLLHESMGDIKISVNLNKDGTEAVIKVAGALLNWVTGKPFSGAVIRVFTEADHDEAVALVTAANWPPLSPPDASG